MRRFWVEALEVRWLCLGLLFVIAVESYTVGLLLWVVLR